MAERVNRYGHESAAINWRRVLTVAAVLGLICVIAVAGNYLAAHVWLVPDHQAVVARPGRVPPQPRLQPDPDNDLATLRAAKHRLLTSYAWTDPSHAFARIPIERAMALYARGHATASTPAAGASAAKPAPASSAGGRP